MAIGLLIAALAIVGRLAITCRLAARLLVVVLTALRILVVVVSVFQFLYATGKQKRYINNLDDTVGVVAERWTAALRIADSILGRNKYLLLWPTGVYPYLAVCVCDFKSL